MIYLFINYLSSADRKKTKQIVDSATWYTTHVFSTVSTTVLSDPLLL
jgi:hypothetical protein